MDRVAVFVDAGYLFAQGSVVLTGAKRPRRDITLDAEAAVAAFRKLASSKAKSCQLLRIYWYDGVLSGHGPTTDQIALAHMDDVKLRLGIVNSSCEQKEVDSLLVTDLIELARLKAISEGVLLAGDGDLRVGVQIAQNYGVRIHVVGIHPARGSQSPHLLQEADTTSEWKAQDVDAFLTVRSQDASLSRAKHEAAASMDAPEQTAQSGDDISAVVSEFVASLQPSEIEGVLAHWRTQRSIPADLDRKLLPKCAAVLGRALTQDEVRFMRRAFRSALKGDPAP